MFKDILIIFGLLFATICRGEYLSWPYSDYKAKSESREISYNLRTIRPVMESDERMGVTYSKVYRDFPKPLNIVDINIRIPVLSYLDFSCKYKKGDDYPTKVSLCWSHLEIAAFHTNNDMGITGGSAAILLPFFAGSGFIVDFGLAQYGYQSDEIFDGLCGITFLMWQEETRLRLVWIKVQSEGAIKEIWKNPEFTPDIFRAETGFARGISFMRTILALEAQLNRNESLSTIEPICKIRLETLPFKGFFVGLEGKVRKGEKSWGVGIYLNPEYWR